MLATAVISVSLLCLGCMWCFLSLFLVVSTSAIDCLERFVYEMTCYVLSGMLNSAHFLTQCELLYTAAKSQFLVYAYNKLGWVTIDRHLIYCISVIFVNENENVEKRENNEFVNENENENEKMMKTKTKLKRKNRKRLKTKTKKSKTKTKMPK